MRLVSDVEFYPNYFEVGFKEFGKENYKFFEISEFKNERLDIIKYLQSDWHILITFNGLHYDNLMLNCVIRHGTDTLKYLEKLNNAIIGDDFDYYRNYKKKLFKSTDIDLYTYWSKMLRMSMKISLKGLMVQLNMPLIQELPYEPGTYLTESQMAEVKAYNVNDLQATELLAVKMEKDIKIRFSIANEKGFDCHSWDQIKLASHSLLDAYCKPKGLDTYEMSKTRFEKPTLYLKDLIDVDFGFKTPQFQNLLKKLKESVDIFSQSVLFNCNNTNVLITYGMGGIHSVNKNQVFKTDSLKQLLTSDVALA